MTTRLVTRKAFLSTSAMGLAALAMGAPGTAQARGRPTILLRSAWQEINIGDMGHWIGILALIERHIPEARVILWAAADLHAGAGVLARRFPEVELVRGGFNERGVDHTLTRAVESADMLLHGSGAHISVDLFRHWSALTGKPFGSYGNTYVDGPYGADFSTEPLEDWKVETFDRASFVFTRETLTLEFLKRNRVTNPKLQFAPDATFAFDTLDEARAERFLEIERLEPGKFICVVPKLRHDPYYRMRSVSMPLEEIYRREAHNRQHAIEDHDKLNQMITTWVRETGNQVLLCPEMVYEVALMEPYIVDRLPPDVRPHVRPMHRYWMPDEAASVYKRASAVVSIEMHTPIISVAVGTPAIYIRQPEDSPKGQMWRDIGLGDWMFEIDEMSGTQLSQTLMSIHEDRDAAARKVADSMAFVRRRQDESMAIVRDTLYSQG